MNDCCRFEEGGGGGGCEGSPAISTEAIGGSGGCNGFAVISTEALFERFVAVSGRGGGGRQGRGMDVC